MTDADIRALLARDIPGDVIAKRPVVALGQHVRWMRPVGYVAAVALFLVVGVLMRQYGVIGWVAAIPTLAAGLAGAHCLTDFRFRPATEDEKMARFARVVSLRKQVAA